MEAVWHWVPVEREELKGKPEKPRKGRPSPAVRGTTAGGSGRVLAIVRELRIEREICSLDCGDNVLEIILGLSRYPHLFVLDLGLHLQPLILDKLCDLLGVLLVDAGLKGDRLPGRSLCALLYITVLESFQADAAFDELRLQHVHHLLQPVLVIGVDLDKLVLLVKLDGGIASFEIVPLLDFLQGLIDGVVGLLKVDLRYDVE